MKDPAYTQRYYNKRPHFLFQRSNSMWKEKHGKPRVKSTKNSELILRKCGFCINCLNCLPILPDKVALCPWKPCCRTGPHCLRSMMCTDRQKKNSCCLYCVKEVAFWRTQRSTARRQNIILVMLMHCRNLIKLPCWAMLCFVVFAVEVMQALEGTRLITILSNRKLL